MHIEYCYKLQSYVHQVTEKDWLRCWYKNMRANHSDIGMTQEENEIKGFTENDLNAKKTSSLGYELLETMNQLTCMHGDINKITSSSKVFLKVKMKKYNLSFQTLTFKLQKIKLISLLLLPHCNYSVSIS